ncbi:hypothetical protein BDV18DRAFT_147414 [Aspergillus unguis]
MLKLLPLALACTAAASVTTLPGTMTNSTPSEEPTFTILPIDTSSTSLVPITPIPSVSPPWWSTPSSIPTESPAHPIGSNSPSPNPSTLIPSGASTGTPTNGQGTSTPGAEGPTFTGAADTMKPQAVLALVGFLGAALV